MKINKNFNFKKNLKIAKLGIYGLACFLSFSIADKETIYAKDNKEVSIERDYNKEDFAIESFTFKKNIRESMRITSKKLQILRDLLLEMKQEEVEEVNKDKKLVAITFDDGPGKYTDRLLDILEENDAHATFFVVGPNVDKYGETLVKSYENGNSIAIHSNTHTSFKKQTVSEVQAEIDIVNDKLLDLGITPSKLVRPPYGSINNNIKSNIDYPFILWSVDTLDWKSRNKDKIIEEINKSIEEGSIILMHDIHKTTVDAIEEILPELTDEYEFVTVEELFERNEQVLENNTSYSKVKVLEKAD